MNHVKKHKTPSEDQKHKKARTEFIRLAVCAYMKDKKYITTKKIRRTDFTLSQANKQFFFNKMIKNDVFINNFFLFSNVTCISNNYKSIDEQFSKFSEFVESQNIEIKMQLRRFYGPLISHLYLEILKSKESSHAVDFLRKNAHHLPPDNDPNIRAKNQDIDPNVNLRGRYFINLIKLLSTCLTLDAAENVREIIAFRSSKFEIDINIDAIQILNNFLKNHGNVLLLSTIHTWIHINVIDVRDNKSDNLIFIKEKERRQLTEMKPPFPVKPIKKEPAEVPKAQQNIFKLALKNIHYVVHEMKKVQPEYPHYVKVFDPNKCLTSGHCDKNQCHVAAGFDDSVVKLWQHSSQTLRGKNIYSTFNATTCPWNLNNNFTEEEEEDDEEFPCGISNQSVSGEILLRGHSRGITDLRFSMHYPILLTASKDESMRCWSASNYRCARVFSGHTSPIWCVTESPISSYVATGSKDLTARLWSLEREFPLITYIGHTQDINCVAFHPNGSYVATGSDDFSIRLWSVASGKVFRVFSESKQPITTIAFSPDGKFLAAAGDERKIRILDLAAGQQLCELKEHSTTVTSIAWSISGDKIASGCADGSLKIWNIGKLEGIRTNAENSNSTTSNTPSATPPLAFSNNNVSRVCRVEYSADNILSCIGRK